MLFTESQLGANNAFSILDEAIYLTQDESRIKPQTIPVLEQSKFGFVRIPFYALSELMEDAGIGVEDALGMICQVNEIDSQHMIVSMTEDEAILNPQIAQSLGCVLIPISSNDPIYKMCLEACNAELQGLSEGAISDFINKTKQSIDAHVDASKKSWNHGKTPIGAAIKVGEEIDKLDPNYKFTHYVKDNKRWMQATAISHHPVTIAATLGGVGYLAVKEYRNKPKSTIAKKIASLRRIYAKTLEQARKNPEKAGILKKIASKILGAIDTLLGYLQRKADGK